jgi:dTDP-4-dehydrorhamnose reductase
MKIVVFGAAGQLGSDLCSRLGGEVISLRRADGDLRDPGAIRHCLDTHRPDIIVNCAAYNFVDRAETEPEEAFAVNAWAVRTLAGECARLSATLVHFSTDYVFGLDTQRREPWTETDAPGPISAYGLSKLTGEYWVRQRCPKYFVIRTCGLYGLAGSGGKGGNFVETMLRLARQGKPIRVVNDQCCTPTFTADLATSTKALIATDRFGLYHLTNAGDCTWFEFARAIFQLAGLTVDLTPISSAEFGAPARRPTNSAFNCEKYAALGLPPLRRWQEALAAYMQQRASQ